MKVNETTLLKDNQILDATEFNNFFNGAGISEPGTAEINDKILFNS